MNISDWKLGFKKPCFGGTGEVAERLKATVC